MGQAEPTQIFVLLDDARAQGAADALVYSAPREVFVAYRATEVSAALEAAEEARQTGSEIVGYIAYEAGLALEPKLAELADARSGANGPLVWLGAFDPPERIDATDVPQWLSAHAQGSASIGPLDPQLSPGGYDAAFAALRGDPRGRHLSGQPHLSAGRFVSR